jgi:curved DNA-binding protein CbpA
MRWARAAVASAAQVPREGVDEGMIPNYYYTILEVTPTATQAEIKRAYRRLARQYHPDLTQLALDQHIKQLNEAYKVLGNTTRRAAYDAQCLEEQRRKMAQEHVRQQKPQQQAARQVKQEPEMTWIEGIFGFVRELRRNMREE